jgi:hypothetical protein
MSLAFIRLRAQAGVRDILLCSVRRLAARRIVAAGVPVLGGRAG